MKSQTASATKFRQQPLWREYYQLTKPRVVGLILFTAVIGMFLASPGMVPLDILVLATIGIGLAAAAGATVNQILDVDVDAKMSRTRRRPLPRGNIETGHAFVFAGVLATLSMVILTTWVNPLTALLTFLSLVGYAVVYTVYLKHATPQNIVIGGAAGASPPLLGWVAITGEVSSNALLLFLIIFVWTPPHFWALALYRKKEYAKANIPMLPVTHGSQFTRLQILLYTVLLSTVTLMPFATRMMGVIYLAGTLVLNARFLLFAWQLYRNYSDNLSRRAFMYSIQYLAMLFALMLIDHYWAVFSS